VLSLEKFHQLSSVIELTFHHRYSGSLTTPPCSEGVTWLVATQKLKISPAALRRVVNVVKFNSRITQNALGEPNILSFAAQSALGGATTA
jgi:carbonic anhydrase